MRIKQLKTVPYSVSRISDKNLLQTCYLILEFFFILRIKILLFNSDCSRTIVIVMINISISLRQVLVTLKTEFELENNFLPDDIIYLISLSDLIELKSNLLMYHKRIRKTNTKNGRIQLFQNSFLFFNEKLNQRKITILVVTYKI